MKDIDTKHERILSELDRRRMKRRRDDDEFKVVEGVIDPPTMKVLYKLLNKGVIDKLHGVISTGKEASVYCGEDPDGELVAVKIYRLVTAESDYMLEYIIGDPRFRKVRRNPRSLIPLWALKEFKNLQRYHDSGVRVPKPLAIERNVLVMEFIGDNEAGRPAPLLKNVEVPSPVELFNDLIEIVLKGYKEGNLVHGDLSEYNILWWDGPVIIDVSQAVLKNHDRAKQYLLRDIKNLTYYFSKLGVEPEEPKEIAKYILAAGE